MAYGQVLARFGHALSDPTRARVLRPRYCHAELGNLCRAFGRQRA
jgi:hypothetical protein